MIKHLNLNNFDNGFTLSSDLAGEFPIYIYLSDDKKELLYSNDILELLNNERIKKPLKVSDNGMSFLLQSGVIAPPNTIYKDIFILGIGDKAVILSENQKIKIEFSHEFPFMNENRLEEMDIDEKHILDLVGEAAISRIEKDKPTYLFHSAGKDSNTIALALAKVGYKDNITLVTHKSKGDKDESEISKSIAQKLGFKHSLLYEVDELENKHKESIINYFKNSPFPSTDNVTLAYPLYSHQLVELHNSNIIDGGGNDTYMMTPPSSRELKILKIAKYTSKLSFLRNLINSESFIMKFLRTPPEWFGMSGLSYKDSKSIFKNSVNVYNYWNDEFYKRSKWDIFDFKTDIHTTVVASEMHIRKVRSFTNSINSNLILPFANKKVATYFSKMPTKYLFNRNTLKNKLILRDILKQELDLDSDVIGKMGFSYDSGTLIQNNWNWMKDEILRCPFWNKSNVLKIINRIESNKLEKNSKGSMSRHVLYRLFLVSTWLNNNKYTN